MKHIHWSGILTLSLLLGVTACQEKKKTTSSSSSNVGTTSGGFTTGGSTTGSTVGGYTTGTVTGGGTTSGSTTGGATTGTVTGGSSSAYAVTVAMSGRGGSCESVYPSAACDSWFMGMVPSGSGNTDVQVGEFIPLTSNNIAFFAADAYFKVRLTVLPQPQISNTTTGQYCWGRINQTQGVYYSKMRYTIGIRDITLRNGVYNISGRYAMLNPSVNSVAVNGAEIYDFSSRLNPTRDGFDVIGYAVDVSDVQSDTNCQGTSSQCGSLGVSSVKDGMCWSVKLELSTDTNQAF